MGMRLKNSPKPCRLGGGKSGLLRAKLNSGMIVEDLKNGLLRETS